MWKISILLLLVYFSKRQREPKREGEWTRVADSSFNKTKETQNDWQDK